MTDFNDFLRKIQTGLQTTGNLLNQVPWTEGASGLNAGFFLARKEKIIMNYQQGDHYWTAGLEQMQQMFSVMHEINRSLKEANKGSIPTSIYVLTSIAPVVGGWLLNRIDTTDKVNKALEAKGQTPQKSVFDEHELLRTFAFFMHDHTGTLVQTASVLHCVALLSLGQIAYPAFCLSMLTMGFLDRHHFFHTEINEMFEASMRKLTLHQLDETETFNALIEATQHFNTACAQFIARNWNDYGSILLTVTSIGFGNWMARVAVAQELAGKVLDRVMGNYIQKLVAASMHTTNTDFAEDGLSLDDAFDILNNEKVAWVPNEAHRHYQSQILQAEANLDDLIEMVDKIDWSEHQLELQNALQDHPKFKRTDGAADPTLDTYVAFLKSRLVKLVGQIKNKKLYANNPTAQKLVANRLKWVTKWLQSKSPREQVEAIKLLTIDGGGDCDAGFEMVVKNAYDMLKLEDSIEPYTEELDLNQLLQVIENQFGAQAIKRSFIGDVVENHTRYISDLFALSDEDKIALLTEYKTHHPESPLTLDHLRVQPTQEQLWDITDWDNMEELGPIAPLVCFYIAKDRSIRANIESVIERVGNLEQQGQKELAHRLRWILSGVAELDPTKKAKFIEKLAHLDRDNFASEIKKIHGMYKASTVPLDQMVQETLLQQRLNTLDSVYVWLFNSSPLANCVSWFMDPTSPHTRNQFITGLGPVFGVYQPEEARTDATVEQPTLVDKIFLLILAGLAQSVLSEGVELPLQEKQSSVGVLDMVSIVGYMLKIVRWIMRMEKGWGHWLQIPAYNTESIMDTMQQMMRPGLTFANTPVTLEKAILDKQSLNADQTTRLQTLFEQQDYQTAQNEGLITETQLEDLRKADHGHTTVVRIDTNVERKSPAIGVSDMSSWLYKWFEAKKQSFLNSLTEEQKRAVMGNWDHHLEILEEQVVDTEEITYPKDLSIPEDMQTTVAGYGLNPEQKKQWEQLVRLEATYVSSHWGISPKYSPEIDQFRELQSKAMLVDMNILSLRKLSAENIVHHAIKDIAAGTLPQARLDGLSQEEAQTWNDFYQNGRVEELRTPPSSWTQIFWKLVPGVITQRWENRAVPMRVAANLQGVHPNGGQIRAERWKTRVARLKASQSYAYSTTAQDRVIETIEGRAPTTWVGIAGLNFIYKNRVLARDPEGQQAAWEEFLETITPEERQRVSSDIQTFLQTDAPYAVYQKSVDHIWDKMNLPGFSILQPGPNRWHSDIETYLDDEDLYSNLSGDVGEDNLLWKQAGWVLKHAKQSLYLLNYESTFRGSDKTRLEKLRWQLNAFAFCGHHDIFNKDEGQQALLWNRLKKDLPDSKKDLLPNSLKEFEPVVTRLAYEIGYLDFKSGRSTVGSSGTDQPSFNSISNLSRNTQLYYEILLGKWTNELDISSATPFDLQHDFIIKVQYPLDMLFRIEGEDEKQAYWAEYYATLSTKEQELADPSLDVFLKTKYTDWVLDHAYQKTYKFIVSSIYSQPLDRAGSVLRGVNLFKETFNYYLRHLNTRLLTERINPSDEKITQLHNKLIKDQLHFILSRQQNELFKDLRYREGTQQEKLDFLQQEVNKIFEGIDTIADSDLKEFLQKEQERMHNDLLKLGYHNRVLNKN